MLHVLDGSFLCVTDIKKQSQMAALSKERDNLRSAIKAYRSLFDTTQQLVKELRSTYFGRNLLTVVYIGG